MEDTDMAIDRPCQARLDVEKNQDQLRVPADHQGKESVFKNLGILDRYLAVWIFLAMAVGIILAVGLLVMMYPILCKVRYEELHHVFKTSKIWTQIAFSIVLNWIVAPFFMVKSRPDSSFTLALAWAFLPDQSELRQGLILVGIARCIAMVLIWTGLAGGDEEYCAILVAVNSLLQMVLFAPFAVLFIRIFDGDGITFEYSVVAKSVAIFLGIPLGAAIITRFLLLRAAGEAWYSRVFLKFASPWSLIGLLFTILVLFASQGHQVVHQIVSVIRVAAPLVVYFTVIFSLTMIMAYKLGFGYKLAATQSFTAASNNFELAIAVAVATFGADSNQALAATVGPLIEVPVLLGLVYGARFVADRLRWRD
ncbi:hypothetical protein UA08_06927 [Talaromyces atroroseus]|uniref:Arsenical-resistance protein n=1 Tax=Talaromyces atroroseus TaxID=1441469 RepID=A0A225AW61_TALAT|nr:hypothetical protein UA08_06927 [Talaromyces atroroseus]OKL57737.1 hypothetical protein UA08_06927 [Talaromyces atroroseus]